MGRIGEQVARRGRAFDMTVLYCNRRRRPEAEAALGARHVTQDELLATSDYVVLTVPLTRETQRLIGRAELARMKPTAILVNVARGGVVDTDALTEALATRRFYAAALDVTDPEPLPRDHPLLRLDNVIITPHLGSATEETRRRMTELSVANLLAGLAGEPLRCRVDVQSDGVGTLSVQFIHNVSCLRAFARPPAAWFAMSNVTVRQPGYSSS